MQLMTVLRAFESYLIECGIPEDYELVSKTKDQVSAVINYEQPDTGTTLQVTMNIHTQSAELAVVHLYGYGKGIDLV